MHFGTDGIRSKAVDFNGEFLDRVARAIVFTYGKISVFIGRDTRVSGLEIVRLLAQALNSYGAKVTLLGIVPTPTLAYLVKAHKADLGVMVSASHNPPEYNGIKIFNGNGKKLTTAEEKALDELIGTPINLPKAKVANLKELSSGKYVEWIKKIFSDKLKGLRILLDTANGATAELAPKVFKELGCKVEVINNDQDGKAINVNCGATHLKGLIKKESEGEYDLAFAFDGDGDRVMAVRKGNVIDGDRTLFVTARYLQSKGRLTPPVVIGTINSNMGLEKALEGIGVEFYRTSVGDKFVAERMEKECAKIGGESSGHIILREYATTGDGILTALFMSMIEAECGIDTLDNMVAYPACEDEIYADIDVKKRFENEQSIANYIASLSASQGIRVVARASGTEPKIRLLVEAETYEKARENVALVKCFITGALERNMPKEEHKTICSGNQIFNYNRKNIDELTQNGVTIIDPNTTFIDERATIGVGSVIYPMNNVLGHTVIGENVTVYSYCDLTDCVIGDGVSIRSTYAIEAVIGARSTIGPFACLRKGARIGESSRIGDFVEVKNSTLGVGVKAAHLAYVGDAEVGDATNIGCGTIFANYNGKIKRRTTVGKGVFIGCNTNLIAPVTIGDGVFIAGGSTVTEDVDGGKFVISRVAQQVKEKRK